LVEDSADSVEEWVEDSAGVVQVEVGRMVQKHVHCSLFIDRQ